MRRAFCFLGVAVSFFSATRASAGGPLGAQGSRIQTSDYGVDLFQGPVLATTRITALAGAYTAVAEGTEGIQFNPAAASLRSPYSTTRTDWDLTAGLTLPASVRDTDFDNNGTVGFAYDNFFWATFGGLLQIGKLGFGLLGALQNYSLGVPGEPVPLPNSNEIIAGVTIRLVRVDPVISYAFLAEQLHIGVGLRYASFNGVGNTGVVGGKADQERILLQSTSLSAQAGALWAPTAQPIRIGAAVRSPGAPIESDPGRIAANADGDRVVGNIYLPTRLDLPWEVEAGFAIQLWKRPLNIPWTDEATIPQADIERWRRDEHGVPEAPAKGARRMLRARYHAIPRERVLLTASALMTGGVKDGVGIESMLSQTVDRSGEKLVVTLRGGAEAEVIPTWLVLRAGSYLEPTRFRLGETRLHGTAGVSVRVIKWSVFGLFDEDQLFRISLAGDIARDYFGWSVGAGLMR